ncbi:MAG: transposon-encoded TnpW family protein [Ruminococcus sp.]|nr:transposon-encoded TnpW family protein [Ruminococcus sp.]
MNENTITTVSEYQIGHTTYRVTTTFNPAFRESLSDILKRLIIRECNGDLGDIGKESEKQAV